MRPVFQRPAELLKFVTELQDNTSPGQCLNALTPIPRVTIKQAWLDLEMPTLGNQLRLKAGLHTCHKTASSDRHRQQRIDDHNRLAIPGSNKHCLQIKTPETIQPGMSQTQVCAVWPSRAIIYCNRCSLSKCMTRLKQVLGSKCDR